MRKIVGVNAIPVFEKRYFTGEIAYTKPHWNGPLAVFIEYETGEIKMSWMDQNILDTLMEHVKNQGVSNDNVREV